MLKCLRIFLLLTVLHMQGNAQRTVTISKDRLLDKIKGGWAGQAIGVTFGGPTEFRYCGTFIQDYQSIAWYDGYLKKTMEDVPDLYDDIYMDLTFVDILEREGLDAPVDSFAQAFARAGYNLWHANQSARYNILNGIRPPLSGHWLNNPHADDIDYQIESDFAGLMSPGMPNSASAISDKVGHIMNYGDGWYGGVYVGAMYTLAFVSDDVQYIVKEALKTIPAQSSFHQCMSDVIRWHEQYPDDWKQAWFELQKKWAQDIGCPDGVFATFDIDAKINAAYILLGLLYGNGDYTQTLEIATRAGQDSDCNPSSAGGILGAMLGYNRIPGRWKLGLKEIEDMDFKYTSMSLNKVYDISYRHALEMIRRNGGTVSGDQVVIRTQQPAPVRLEQSFEGLTPVARTAVDQDIAPETRFEFEGTGFVLRGSAQKKGNNAGDYTFNADLYIDDVKVETGKFPVSYHSRRNELFWKYQLPQGKHQVRIVVQNPSPDHVLRTWDYVAYSRTDSFSNPISSNGDSYQDPWVIKAGSRYYYTGSTGKQLYIYSSANLHDILTKPRTYVYTAPAGTDHSSELWAPELHYLRGRWYIYYAADDGKNEHHRMYVLEGGTDANDPLNGTFTFKGKLAVKDDRWAIDGSPFEYNGQLYFVWSGWPGDTNGMQCLYIAKMSNPYTLTGERVEISRPDRDWEKIGDPDVNEGPEILIHGKTINIIYSASGSWTDDYCLGALACTNGNPMSKSSWTKKGPVFARTESVFGPGHASFVRSPDNKQWWIVYHAAKRKGSGWNRNVRMQPFSWKGDVPEFGRPVEPGKMIAAPQ